MGHSGGPEVKPVGPEGKSGSPESQPGGLKKHLGDAYLWLKEGCCPVGTMKWPVQFPLKNHWSAAYLGRCQKIHFFSLVSFQDNHLSMEFLDKCRDLVRYLVLSNGIMIFARVKYMMSW